MSSAASSEAYSEAWITMLEQILMLDSPTGSLCSAAGFTETDISAV